MRTLLLILAFLGCVPIARPLSEDRQPVVAVGISTYCIRLHGGVYRQAEWMGSGVIIGERDVLTAAHVVKCKPGWVLRNVVLRSASWVGLRDASLIFVDTLHDAAHLRVQRAYEGAPRLLLAKPRLGLRACAWVSRPVAGRRCGVITALGYRQAASGVLVDIEFSWTAVGGNSGSPVFDAQGRLVGLVTHRYTQQPGGLATSLISLGLLREP